MKLPRSFYLQPTLKVAQKLLGKFLIHKYRGKRLSGKIVETEAYLGPWDKAAHSYNFKRTPKTEVEYWKGGYIYIYLVYGMYYNLNVTTELEGKPECVLIRALEPVEGIKQMAKNRNIKIQRDRDIINLANGPGKLCEALRLNKKYYGEDLCGNRVWIEDRGEKIRFKNIVISKRVGIDYAEEDANLPWRFYIRDNKFVSRE